MRLALCLALLLCGPAGAEPFSFEILAQKARELAQSPYEKPKISQRDVLEKIDFDAHWQIRYRPQQTVTLGDLRAQMFHLGTYFREPVAIFTVAEGEATPLPYRRALFDMPEDSPARALAGDAGFAGLRLMNPDLKSDWVSFLGASYFRTEGQVGQYGLSARGLAIDTGLEKGEEFPRFTAFYLAQEQGQAVVYASLDSRSLTGAYRIKMSHKRGQGQVMEVQSRLFLRADVARLGVAPLTSMYWYSETYRGFARDWRPEVHDSDGLLVETQSPLWRPLDSPEEIETSQFESHGLKGFGLVQRDRDFSHYQDDGVFYDRRPSVWVEPMNDWGAGAVTLVELPTHDEIYDNIVAFWSPSTSAKAGQALAFDYRLTWANLPPRPETLAQVVATRAGLGGNPGQERPADQSKIVIDFKGDALADLTPETVQPQVEIVEGAGEITQVLAHSVSGNPRLWRLVFDVKAKPAQRLMLRAGLSAAGQPVTETWLAPLHPARVIKGVAKGAH